MIHDHTQFSVAHAYRGNVGEVVRQFLPMVRKLAWHFAGSGGPTVDVDDLMQSGLLVLTECVHRHEGRGEDGFAAYAKMRVRGAMIDQLRKSSFVPRRVKVRRREIEDARARLFAATGQEPSDAELAVALDIPVEEIRQSQQDSGYIAVPFEESGAEAEPSMISASPNPEEIVATHDERESLVRAIRGLPERQAQVIQLYFVEELNLAEIAAVLGVSVPRVHQIKSTALSQIRRQLDCGELGPE